MTQSCNFDQYTVLRSKCEASQKSLSSSTSHSQHTIQLNAFCYVPGCCCAKVQLQPHISEWTHLLLIVHFWCYSFATVALLFMTFQVE